ncbi:GNAT family N-acetyltransferase [Streptomyces sp. CHA1]|uniref:GNAT family N-acetyltransferase n=1 Tax=Streptomyces TaxID=1883 RepID=UPI0003C32110|nr:MULTISPECIES: GNAT family N-acetyltransferase [unclassified Streptomyces]WSB21830.1 GNAT family N-acetyltransferase [Streptomyces albidoflavus]ESP99095.1 acetyltransferase, GNAT family protein [Streptomyces sp. GBA 94-10 4N24]MBT3157571.1 GNAT family N-acetyltransferase [Streptomyces sp. G11C]MCO6701406.1 GNAT family N-acetyltransferase [Streptomyces sp. CHB9.2]MCO6707659.1 GNAT family N-acetyltransferase [Streptomyces sp. CHA3]
MPLASALPAHHDRTGRLVTLGPVTDASWRAVADLAPRDDQRRFVAALGARYLLLSLREEVWTSLAVDAAGRTVGHVMWAYDAEEDVHWIGGMLVDAAEQGRGVGRAALAVLLDRLAADPGCREIRLSVHPGNTTATRLYTALGFRPTGLMEDDEAVLAWTPPA